MKRPYRVRLSSDDVSNEVEMDLSQAQLDFLLSIADLLNTNAGPWSVTPRMHVETPDSSAPQGDAAA